MDGWSVMSPTHPHPRTHGHISTGPLHPFHHGTALPHHSWVLSRPHSLPRVHRGGAGRVAWSLGRSDFCSHGMLASTHSPAAHVLPTTDRPHPRPCTFLSVCLSVSLMCCPSCLSPSPDHPRLSRLISSLVSSPCLALVWFGSLVGWSACVVWWLGPRSLTLCQTGSFMWMDGWMDGWT